MSILRIRDSGKVFDIVSAIATVRRFEGMNDIARESLEITIRGSSYQEIKNYFTNGILFELEDDSGIYTKHEYSIAGPISDNRNGEFTIYMGKPTDREIMADLLNGLVADHIITSAQKAQIINERLPQEELIVRTVDVDTGEPLQIKTVQKYIME